MDNLTRKSRSNVAKSAGGGSRGVGVLTKLLCAVAIIAALMAVFTFLPTEESYIGKVLDSAGIVDTSLETAFAAWQMPNGEAYPLSGNNQSQGVSQSDFLPGKSNYGSPAFSGDLSNAESGATINNTGFSGTIKEEKHAYMVFYWDIKLDAYTKEAIANGQLTYIKADMSLRSGSTGDKNSSYGGRSRGYFFGILASNDEAKVDISASIIGQQKTADSFDYDRTNSYNESAGTHTGSVTITFSEYGENAANAQRIRFGFYVHLNREEVGAFFVDNSGSMRCDTLSCSVSSDIYYVTDNGANVPKIDIGIATGQSYGKIYLKSDDTKKAINTGTVWKAYFKNGNNASNEPYSDTALENVIAEANEGYYFSGWSISKGTISNFGSGNYGKRELVLSGGAYLHPSNYSNAIVIRANFRAISATAEASYTYLQNSSFESVAQGPSATVPDTSDAKSNGTATGVTYRFCGGILENNMVIDNNEVYGNTSYVYYGTKKDGADFRSSSKPTEAGSYTYRVGVFLSTSNNYEYNYDCLGYYVNKFDIDQLEIGTTDGWSVDTPIPINDKDSLTEYVNSDSTAKETARTVGFAKGSKNHTYTGEAVEPALEYVIIKKTVNGEVVRYKIPASTSFEIEKYDNNTDASKYTQQKYAYAVISCFETGNFSGKQNVPFIIKQLSIQGDTIPAYTAGSGLVDITTIYRQYYTGYDMRPQPIMLKIIKNSKTYKLFMPDYIYGSGESYVKMRGDLGLNNNPDYAKPSTGIVNNFSFYNNFTEAASAPNVAVYGNNLNVGIGYFYVHVDANLLGTVKVEFEIKPLDLEHLSALYPGAEIVDTHSSESDVAVLAYSKASMEYNRGERKPLPVTASIELTGVPHFIFEGGIYTSTSTSRIRLDLMDANGVTREGSSANIPAGITRETVHGYYVGPSDIGGTNPFTYENNVNVYYDNGIKPNATIKITLASQDQSSEGLGDGESPLKANVIGSFTNYFCIKPKSITPIKGEGEGEYIDIVTFTEVKSQIYTGSALTTTFKLSCNTLSGTDRALAKDTDFTVAFSENVNVSRTALITVTGKGNFEGTAKAYFYIGARDLSSPSEGTPTTIRAESEVSGLGSFTYTGKTIQPSPTEIGNIVVTVPAHGTGENYVAEQTYTLGSGEYEIKQDPSPDNASKYNKVVGGNNYVLITFKGVPSTDSANWAVAGNGNYCLKADTSLQATFTITPKQLSDITLAQSFARFNPTYEGTSLTSFSYETGKGDTNSNLYLYDKDALYRQELSFYGKNNADYDYKLDESFWTDSSYWQGNPVNVNAGTGAGKIRFTGHGNYTGTLILSFDILQRDISSNSSDITITLNTSAEKGYGTVNNNSGFFFTGSQITPEVSSVKDSGVNGGVFLGSEDFYVTYGFGDDNDNVNVYRNGSNTNAGRVTINGTGNYKGRKNYDFNILPKEQTIVFETPVPETPVTTDDVSKIYWAESIAYKGNTDYSFYADFECNGANTVITLVARTTAIYPTPRRITFHAVTIGTDSTPISDVTFNYYKDASATIKEYNVSIVEIDGVEWAQTVATLTLSDKYYGIIRVYAEQNDSTVNDGAISENVKYKNEGNYQNSTLSDVDFRFFAKHVDYTATGEKFSDKNKTYGNPRFTLEPGLNSYVEKVDGNALEFPFDVTSDREDVVSVISGSGATRVLQINGAGVATITVSHSGHVGDNQEYAYLPFSASITINVAPRNLFITAEEKKVTYGDNVSAGDFTIKYVTSQGTVTDINDTYNGLSYGTFGDNIEDIIGLEGVQVGYFANLFWEVGEYGTAGSGLNGVELYQTPNPTGARSKANNYIVTFDNNVKLTVKKKEAEVHITVGSAKDSLTRYYGQANPTDTDYDFYITGLINSIDNVSENDKVINGWTNDEYATFYIDYGSVSITSDAGSYTVYITGATAKNYKFKDVPVTLRVSPAPVTITLETRTEEYTGGEFTANGAVVTGVTGIKDENNNAFDWPVPQGKLEYRYQYFNGYQKYAPYSAGKYNVEVRWIAATKEELGENVIQNYASTVVIFEEAVYIQKVLPRIEYQGVQMVPYSSEGVDPSLCYATIGAIMVYNEDNELVSVGSVPLSTKATYEFRKHGTTDDYTDHLVNGLVLLDIGVYDVRVHYQANELDNYCSGFVELEAVYANGALVKGLTVKAGLAEIKLLNPLTKVYNGVAANFEKSRISFIFRNPYDSSIVQSLDAQYATIYYIKNDGTESTVAPVDVGNYTVKVVFNENDEEEAIASFTEANLTDAIIIKPYDLKDGGISFSPTFTGIDVEYNGEEHALRSTDITKTGVSGGLQPTGQISISYKKAGVFYSAPVNAGTYTICVSYIPGPNDNYTMSLQYKELTEYAVVISKTNVTIEFDSSYDYSYNFNGQPRSVTVKCEGKIVNGKPEALKGTVKYDYILNGTYIEGLPVNAGSYGVKVTYIAAEDDNYIDNEETFSSVLTINAISPSIVIIEKEFAFGAPVLANELYTIRGAQSDRIGPVVFKDGESAITVQYGVRRINLAGVAYYEWSPIAPTEPGKYSVQVIFNPLEGENNYLYAVTTRYECLTIANAVPELSLDNREVTYNGNRYAANIAIVRDSYGNVYTKYVADGDEEHYYRGNLNYEYRLAGSNAWMSIAPSNAGVYDVRVTYLPNTQGDVFSAGVLVAPAALTIKALDITVIPVYGHGKDYDGVTETASDLAFVYKYEAEGPDGSTYVYYVYSKVTEKASGNRIDVSKFTYADEYGNVYVVENGSGDAWRDYYETAIELVSGSFKTLSAEINVDFTKIGASHGQHVYVEEQSGVRYIIDLDYDIAYEASGVRAYSYDIEKGYYISSVDEAGRVTVINIPAKSIVYTDVERNLATYTRNVAGRNVVYKLDLNAMTALNSGVTYKIYTEVGIFSFENNGVVEQVRIDFNNMYDVNASANTALYKTGNDVYVIDFEQRTAIKVYNVSIDVIKVSYFDEEGEKVSSNVAVADLTDSGFDDAYIGNCTLDNNVITVYLNKRVARVRLYYSVEQRNGAYYLNGQYVDHMDKTSRYNVFTYTPFMSDTTYYIDLNTMTARLSDERYTFFYSSEYPKGAIEKVGGGSVVAVDGKDFEYTIYRGDKALGTTSLYGLKLITENPALITGNSWTGGLSLLARDAGNYVIGGALGAGSNYSVTFTPDMINYVIGKIKLNVSFIAPEDNIYNGDKKGVGYVLEGVLNNDDVHVSLIYGGDNCNVTDLGYYAELSIVSVNYYIESGVSPTYYIERAVMNAPTYDETLTSVKYDGGRHSVPVYADRDAEVYYNGSLSVPYYIEPGLYRISVSVEKRNYETVTLEITLAITKSVYRVTPNQVAGTLRYGDDLPSLTSNSTLGTISLDLGQTLIPGLNSYTWTFTPYDTDFYRYYEAEDGSARIAGTIDLQVEKAKADITVNGNLTQSETDPKAITGSINGLLDFESSDNVTVVYIDSNGNRYSSMPTAAGKYTILVTYEGDEYYERTEQYFTLTIEKETNLTWLYYVGGVLIILGMLSTVFFIIRKGKKVE